MSWFVKLGEFVRLESSSKVPCGSERLECGMFSFSKDLKGFINRKFRSITRYLFPQKHYDYFTIHFVNHAVGASVKPSCFARHPLNAAFSLSPNGTQINTNITPSPKGTIHPQNTPFCSFDQLRRWMFCPALICSVESVSVTSSRGSDGDVGRDILARIDDGEEEICG